MKNGITKPLYQKRTKTALTQNQETTRINIGTRKTSNQTIESQEQQDKLYFSTRPTSIKKHRNTQSLCDGPTKSGSQRQIKIASKDFQDSNIIREGDTYKKISPKVIFQNDQINVYFVKEVNKYTLSSDTKIHHSDIGPKQVTMQEVTNSKVSIKGPIASSQNVLQARITQGILSNPKHLFGNKKNQETVCNVKTSLQKLLKLYH